MNDTLPHIHVRAMEPEDLELLYQIENAPEIWQVGTTNVPYSRYLLQDFITRSTGDIYTDKQVRLMIENERKETIGIVDIMNFDPRHMRAEIGIIIRPAYRQQGYGLSTLRTVRAYSKHTLHLHQLYAIVASNNEASLKLFLKAEFKASCELRDWLYEDGEYHPAIVMQTFL